MGLMMTDVRDYKVTIDAEGGDVGKYLATSFQSLRSNGNIGAGVAVTAASGGVERSIHEEDWVPPMLADSAIQFVAIGTALGGSSDHAAMLNHGIAAVESATGGLLARVEKMSVVLEREATG